MHSIESMARVGQIGKFTIYVFAPSKHSNNYIKVKGKGGVILGKFRLDILEWESAIALSPSDKTLIEKWVTGNIESIRNKINTLARL